jgi:hypothetical protein
VFEDLMEDPATVDPEFMVLLPLNNVWPDILLGSDVKNE